MEPTTRLSTGAALTAIRAALAAIDHPQRTRISHHERLTLLQTARRAQGQLAGLVAMLTGEAEANHSAEAVAGTQLPTLLGQQEHLDVRDALRSVTQARDIAHHDDVAHRVIDGSLSPQHAQAIRRTLDTLPHALNTGQRDHARQYLIDKAATVTPGRLTASTDDLLAAVAPELVPTAEERDARLARQRADALARRSFTWGEDTAHPGSWYFKGSLPTLEAEQVIRAITIEVNHAKRAQRRQHRRHDTPRWDQRQADALTTLATTAAPPADPPQPETPTLRQAQGVSSSSTNRGSEGSDASNSPDPYTPATLVVTIDYTELATQLHASGQLPSGARLPAKELRRLACDAQIIPIVLGAQAEILDVGRAHRFVTPAIRHALNLRDNGCIFPGCHATALECDAHHVIPWWAGGSTSLENLALLCPYHHPKVEPTHTGPAAGTTSPDGWHITFNPHTGRPTLRREPPDTGRPTLGREPPDTS